MTKPPYLTKSRYLDGLRCEKKLWLGWYERLPYEDTPPYSILDFGNRVGRGAWVLFPGGVEVTEKPYEHDAAVAMTVSLMAGDAPAIFEAAFEFANIRIRVDVLERLDDGWGLREVKSSKKVEAKKYHFDDAAVQLYVLEGCGITVNSVELIHTNRAYLRGQGEVDWQAMLTRTDIELQARDLLSKVKEALPRLFSVLAKPSVPYVHADKSLCKNPYQCDYFDHCMSEKPEGWVGLLHNVRTNKVRELHARGIDLIVDLPEDLKLSDCQAHALNCLSTGHTWVSKELPEVLKYLGPPAYYMDFETMAPTIPAYPDTRPGQELPFQWSVHYLAEDSTLDHKAFLAKGDTNPAREFAETLINAIDNPDAPVVVYNKTMEGKNLKALAKMFADLAEELGAIENAIVDLLDVVRGNYCHPDMIGSRSLVNGTYSIKNVLPILVPHMSYDQLAGVNEGTEARRVFTAIVFGAYTGRQADDYRQQLRDYCKQDTLAMVEVQRALEALAA